jgi:hypothetical protein
MSTNNFFKSDLFDIHNVVQASMIVYPKEIILSTLKDYFSKDSYYHFSKDQWGFPNTTDHTDLPPGADLPVGSFGSTAVNGELLSTRLFIGENYRHDGAFYPAILVKNAGSKYVPISINREKGGVQYEDVVFEDGYGNQTIVHRPVSLFTAGVWEGQIVIDVISRSLRARDDLVELIGLCFSEISVDSLYDVGLIVKPPNIGSPSETDDRNDKLFRQSITLDIRTEWRREIPVGNIIDTILFTASFEDISRPTSPVAQNMSINTELNVLDMLLNL